MSLISLTYLRQFFEVVYPALPRVRLSRCNDTRLVAILLFHASGMVSNGIHVERREKSSSFVCLFFCVAHHIKTLLASSASLHGASLDKPGWQRQREHVIVHITPDKFENATIFLRLGLPSTLIRHEN